MYLIIQHLSFWCWKDKLATFQDPCSLWTLVPCLCLAANAALTLLTGNSWGLSNVGRRQEEPSLSSVPFLLSIAIQEQMAGWQSKGSLFRKLAASGIITIASDQPCRRRREKNYCNIFGHNAWFISTILLPVTFPLQPLLCIAQRN